MARDCPEEPRPKPSPFRPAQNQGNPHVNLVQPQVAAITKSQTRIELEEELKGDKHQRVWRELKEESTQVTKGLRKRTPAQNDATLGKCNP